MPRDGSITVGDLVGKLEYLTIRCDKCGRAGRYRVSRLVEEIGPDGKLTHWKWRVTADCPRPQATRIPTGAGLGVQTWCPCS